MVFSHRYDAELKFCLGVVEMLTNELGSDALVAELSALFRRQGNDDQHVIAGVAALEQQYGNRTYREALRLLVGKNFGSELSRLYWHAVLEHRQRIFLPEFRSNTLRPALLDYLCREKGELEDPRIIDAEFLNNITRSSITDGLTGLYSQTYFKKYLSMILANNRRGSDSEFAIIFFDLDNFKQYNDRCGHLSGDEALRRTAEIIQGSLREGDMAARYGGEEFAVYLPLMNRATALVVAERIRQAIEQELFPGQGRLDRGTLTISGGVAAYPDDGTTMAALIEVADLHMYRAKSTRNCIYSFQDDRRRSLRRPVSSLVEYASLDGALFRPALSQDISELGMGLGCEAQVDPGAVLSLRLTRPFWSDNLLLCATVRQIRRQGDLIFVGLEFERSLESIEELLAATHRQNICQKSGAVRPPLAPKWQ